MKTMLLLVGAAAAAGVLLYVFVRWERSGREHWSLFVLLGLLVFESSLYENESFIPRSVFHPGNGSLQFRLPEVIITLAVLAHVIVRGRPRRAGAPALLWVAVALWWTLEMVEGLLRHNSTVKLPYEAKAVIYVMGAYALASAVPVRRLLEGRGFERLFRWSAASAALLVLLTVGHKTFSANIPLVPLSNFGSLGTDAATLFVSIGVIALVLELAKEDRSRLNLLCVVPLLGSAFFAHQRAVLLTLGAAVAVIIGVAFGTTARHRLRVRAGEVAIAVLAVVGVVLGVSVIPALAGGGTVSSPIVSTITKTVGATLGSQAKAESAQSRINKWTVAIGFAKQHTFLGQGLGFEYTYFTPGPNVFVTTDLTENIGLDLWLRTGLLGLALFLLALVTSLVNGFAAWRLHPDRMVAVAALALIAVVVGLVAKGQVESIFENYRIATLLGVSLGMLRSAVTSGGGSPTDMRTLNAMRQYEVV